MESREKRRVAMARQLRNLNETFSSERDVHYSEMLHSLQCSLYALHVGNHPEYLERLADLEEARDNKLVELYLWEQYQIQQAEQQYKADLEQASSDYTQMLQLVKDKLRTRLEGQRKRLLQDRALLDIANEHSFFMACSNTSARTRSAQAGAQTGAPADRRSLRRREVDDFSGFSGNESNRSRRAVRNNSHNAANHSDLETGTERDLDGLLHDFDAQSSRHVTKSFQGVKLLRPDEVQADLGQIRENVKRFKR